MGFVGIPSTTLRTGSSRSKDALRMTARTDNRRSFDRYRIGTGQAQGSFRSARRMGIDAPFIFFLLWVR